MALSGEGAISSGLRAALFAGGWHEARCVDVADVACALGRRAFHVSIATRAALESFHGLTVRDTTRVVVFDALAALARVDDNDLPYLDALAGERPCPIGYSFSADCYLLASGEALAVSDQWFGFARFASLFDLLETFVGEPRAHASYDLAPERVPPEFRPAQTRHKGARPPRSYAPMPRPEAPRPSPRQDHADVPTPEGARSLLATLGAPERLLRHHDLVVEAAVVLVAELRREFSALRFDAPLVLAGAALHDAGKIDQPAELDGPGSAHEPAGEERLLRAGLPPRVARFCRTHADWAGDDVVLEDLLVALADKLWKGKRQDDLETLACAAIATQCGLTHWQAFLPFDGACERVAAGADERLAKSR